MGVRFFMFVSYLYVMVCVLMIDQDRRKWSRSPKQGQGNNFIETYICACWMLDFDNMYKYEFRRSLAPLVIHRSCQNGITTAPALAKRPVKTLKSSSSTNFCLSVSFELVMLVYECNKWSICLVLRQFSVILSGEETTSWLVIFFLVLYI